MAVPIAPRFFVFLAALAASLTLDLLFFFGARGSSASFTFFAFDRGAGGGHEPPLTASARTGRGRASAATVNAARSRARARAMLRVAVQLLRRRCTATSRRRVALQHSAWHCCVQSITARAAAMPRKQGTPQHWQAFTTDEIPTPAARLHRYATRTTSFKQPRAVLVRLCTLDLFFCS